MTATHATVAPKARAPHQRAPQAAAAHQSAPKLGRHSDAMEPEADHTAARVMAGSLAPSPPPNSDPGPGAGPTPAHPALGAGAPLSSELRDYFEPRFGESFKGVRVHTGPQASALALTLGARAFSIGPNIGFAAGEFAPGAPSGRTLIAHELAHVSQHQSGRDRGVLRRDLKEDAQRRTILPSDVKDVDTDTLKAVVAFLEGIAHDNQGTSWEGEDAVLQNLGTVRDELLGRTVDPPAPAQEKAKPALLPGMKGGDDATQLYAAASIIDSLHQIGSDVNEITVEGTVYRLTDAKADEVRTKVRAAFNDALGKAKSDAKWATRGYDIQSEMDKRHWIVSNFVKAVGRIQDPGPQLKVFAAIAGAQATLASAALKSGNFAKAAENLASAETAGRKAKLMYQAYWEDIITTAEFTVTALEYTRDASFIILAVCATIVTAGAAAGVTSIGGVGLGAAGTANLVATAAPVVATFAEAGAKLVAGDKVDWGSLAIDAIIAIVMYRFGGALAGKIGGRILGQNPAAKRLGKQAVANIVSGIIVGRGAAIVQIAVKNIHAAMHGKDVTWGSFLDQVAQNLADPKQAFMDIVLGSIGGYGAAKGSRPSAPKGGGGPPVKATPKAASANEPPAPAAKPKAATVEPATPVEPTPAPKLAAAQEPAAQPAAAPPAAKLTEVAEPAAQPKPAAAAQEAQPAQAKPAAELTVKPEQQAKVPEAGGFPGRPAKSEVAALSTADLAAKAKAAIGKVKAAKTREDITPQQLNEAEFWLREMRQRQNAAPDPALEAALKASVTEYTDAIESRVNLQGAGPTPVQGQTSAAQSARDAQAAGLVDVQEGRVGVQSHSTSSKTRRAVGVSGATHQSAHLVPQAVDRAIGASAGQALTANLPTATHRTIDGDWVPKWNSAVAAGRQITGADVLSWVGQGIQKVPNTMLSPKARNTLEWRLSLELRELGIGPATVIVPAKP